MFKKLADCEPNVLGNLPEQHRRDIAAFMERHGGITTSAITKLLVRTALPDFIKPELMKNSHDFGGPENRNVPHC